MFYLIKTSYKIDEMEQKSQANMLNDLFTSQATNNENTLESDKLSVIFSKELVDAQKISFNPPKLYITLVLYITL